MEGLSTFKNRLRGKEESCVGRWLCVYFTLIDLLVCSFSPNTFLAPYWAKGPPAAPCPSDPVDPKFSHFWCHPFWDSGTSLTVSLSHQSYYCSEDPQGRGLQRLSSFLKSSGQCCWDFSSVVRHDLVQSCLLLLLLISPCCPVHLPPMLSPERTLP